MNKESFINRGGNPIGSERVLEELEAVFGTSLQHALPPVVLNLRLWRQILKRHHKLLAAGRAKGIKRHFGFT